MNIEKSSFSRFFITIVSLFFVLLGCDYTPDKIEHINGSIVFTGTTPSIYTPSAGEVVTWTWNVYAANPGFECKIKNDTLIISSTLSLLLENKPARKSTRYFYKFVPKERYLEPIMRLNDDKYGYHWGLEYNANFETYLSGYSSSDKAPVDSFITYSYSFENYVSKNFYISDKVKNKFYRVVNQGVLFSENWESYYISVNDMLEEKVPLKFPGQIIAISNFGNKLIYKTDHVEGTYKDYYKKILYDFDKKTHTELKISNEIADICFSPDDKYLAYSEITSNFNHDIMLHIYEIKTKSDINTGVRLNVVSPLATWVN